MLDFKKSDFYSNFTQRLEALEEQFSTLSSRYCKNLESLEQQLNKRESNIFTPITFDAPTSIVNDLNTVRDSYEGLRTESNNNTATLSAKQSDARVALRLHEVFTFFTDIKYTDECDAIAQLRDDMEKAEKSKTEAIIAVESKQAKLRELKAQLKDESKGASRVNYFLKPLFWTPVAFS